MENRINTKSQQHFRDVKAELLNHLNDLKRESEQTQQSNLDSVIKYINSIKAPVFTKEDFMKRKRSKNSVSLSDRCMAKRANGEQCSRRKKDGCEYCGTHIKGIPHGVVTTENMPVLKHKEVWCEDIGGIIQYIDTDGNVYSHEDIMNNVVNPAVIAKYEIKDNKYNIINT